MSHDKLVQIIYRTLAIGPVITPDTLKDKAEQIADAIETEGGPAQPK